MAYRSPLEDVYPDGTQLDVIEDASVPWRFSELDVEYTALRERAGIFDHAAVGLILVEGDALRFLQSVLARDVEYLGPERCMLSLMLDDDGVPIDLVTVYNLEDAVIVETAFGRGERTLKYLQEEAPSDVQLTMVEDKVVLGIEGPYSWGVAGRIVDPEFTALPYESVLETDWDGDPILFARSGFTGEYGYKLIAEIETAKRLWAAAVEHASPVGYEALELAMLEVRQPILHREARNGATVIECGFNWALDITKEDFRGRAAVMREFEAGGGVRTVGFTVPDGRLPVGGAEIRAADTVIGRVVHAVMSPGVGGPLGLGRIDRDFAAAGLTLEVSQADGSWSPATTVSSPYLIPASWSLPIF